MTKIDLKWIKDIIFDLVKFMENNIVKWNFVIRLVII